MSGQPIPQAQLDEEEDEDEEALLARMPQDTHNLQECLTASQGCLLLLVLKQHLKTTYGFNDSKITQYSPAESSKTYEKAVNRKSNARFNPKVTVQKIQHGSPPNMLDENARRALISEYLEFKHLMMNLDPDEPDDEDDNHVTPQKASQREHRHAASDDALSRVADQTPIKANSHMPSHMQTDNPHHQLEPQTLRVPKLTIVPPKPPPEKQHHHHRSHKTRKTDRHKKHHHKRKKSKLRSSDESEHEYSDPDFLV
ncbi:nipped-B-like protein A [Nilaparvata lugens]|uniref:nipped-B-like protein A n=1 Tax=Nilaparvata lugens TaxID=108931 RepID=UPI00193DA0BA|nr:nipped-B-like protein A [Nilaparvata lugens]